MTPVSWDSLQRNTIVYSIAASSEYSGRYAAENIRFDRPLDVQSRWSGTRENGLQWVVLELATVGVLDSITFGKVLSFIISFAYLTFYAPVPQASSVQHERVQGRSRHD